MLKQERRTKEDTEDEVGKKTETSQCDGVLAFGWNGFGAGDNENCNKMFEISPQNIEKRNVERISGSGQRQQRESKHMRYKRRRGTITTESLECGEQTDSIYSLQVAPTKADVCSWRTYVRDKK